MPPGNTPNGAELTDVSAVSDELETGSLVGEYRIEGKLGEGGFGKVYRAVHPVIGKRAAIKVLNREYSANPSVVSRFVSEARAVNQIRHRNIIDIFSFGTLEGGLQYFVMELLDGVTLDSYLERRGRLPIEEAVPILRYIARALDAAHEAGIAHRDLKPENVFLTFDEDNGVFPKLLDFGIAKLIGDESVNHKTRTGAAMGTPLYMSPEQCHGKNVDHRTDVYSFGVMTHQMLTGRRPFDGESMMELMLKHVQEAPPPMSQEAPDLPASLDAPVLEMLAKSPDDRPPFLVEAVERLAAVARESGFVVPSRAAFSTTPSSLPQLPTETRSSPSLEEAATAMVDEPARTELGAPAVTGAGRGETQQTMAVPAPASSSRTWLVAAAALAVGVGATLFLTMGGEEGGRAAPSPETNAAEIAPEAPADPVETAVAEPAASAIPAPEETPTAVPAETAPPAPTQKPVDTAAPKIAAPKPPPVAPPPAPPPPPPTIPDDLEF